jgi:3',5'-cyclic AMP phosphodiesterase CpdA
VTTIAHLADLRIGALDRAMEEGVAADVRAIGADLVVVSGNLTRNGAKDQFVGARRFLDSLGVPHIAVPGPRDLGGLNLINRFFRPLQAWRSAMGAEPPFFENAEVAVLGIDTSRSGMGRKLSTAQASLIRERLQAPGKVTVLVSHHVLVPRPVAGTGAVTSRADSQELRVVGSCVDVVLAGHQALDGPQDTRVAYRVMDRQTIVAQAELVPSSSGLRESPPYINAVRVEGDRVTIAVRLWRGREFEEQGPKPYRYTGAFWDKFVDMPPDFQWNDAG